LLRSSKPEIGVAETAMEALKTMRLAASMERMEKYMVQ
jgi:hypothetical protein